MIGCFKLHDYYQSECIISTQQTTYALLKFVHDIESFMTAETYWMILWTKYQKNIIEKRLFSE